MLTADLVRARIKDGALELVRLSPAARKESLALASELLEVTRALVGEPRELVLEAQGAIETRLRLEKVRDGLAKLVLDGCEFEPDSELDPATLREEVFGAATTERRASTTTDGFRRDAVLAEVAARHGLPPAELERLLFSDLRGAHRLLSVPAFEPAGLLRAYELSAAQAVLLRAERVVVEVRCRSQHAYRQLFRRIKFLRLLCVVTPMPDGRYRLVIDGPYSLLASTTKYGLELAMLLPALREVDAFELTAVVRWGKARERVTFTTSGTLAEPRAEAPTPLPPELEAMLPSFRAKHPDYSVEPCDVLVEVRGEAVLVPDLTFVHRETGEVFHLELLGHWSRDAVFRRVELSSKLDTKMIFAFSSRLRVSEDLALDTLPACLCSFKGTLRAGAVHERLELLRARG